MSKKNTNYSVSILTNEKKKTVQWMITEQGLGHTNKHTHTHASDFNLKHQIVVLSVRTEWKISLRER